MVDCTVLILTYKGKHHLEFLLPSIKDAITCALLYTIEVLIVDNGKDEDTRKFVEKNFPEYRYEFSDANDYLFSLNPFVAKMDSEFVLILNDDMKVERNIFNHLIYLMRCDDSIFAINCRVVNWDGSGLQSNVRNLSYRKGWAYTAWQEELVKNITYTLYAGGGSGLFRTDYFNIIGGFDSLFRPAYCEDIDLSHRAWKRGWKVIFQPDAILFHRESATIKEQFSSKELTTKIYTNRILWMLKNSSHPNFLIKFFIYLPYRLIYSFFKNRYLFIALIRSSLKWHRAISIRFKQQKSIIKDDQLVKLIGKPYVR